MRLYAAINARMVLRMNKPKQSKRIQSPTKMPVAITRPLSWIYRVGIGLQNRRFDLGIGVTSIEKPVISVGNISAGGTGKTPMVHWVANVIQENGLKPIIAMRGYKAQPGEMGDEEMVHREKLPGVSVVAQPDRVSGIRKLIACGERFDAVILDDGFQHRQIAREVDIVLIDASHPPFADALLPRGFLRDPVSSLSRVDVVVITHRELVNAGQLDQLAEWISNINPACVIAVSSHVWLGASQYELDGDSWSSESINLDKLINQRVFAACGIGNPDGFYQSIQASQMDLAGRITLDDHHLFGSSTLKNILNQMESVECSTLVMTQKDWVKAREPLLSLMNQGVDQIRVVVPELGLLFQSGEAELKMIVEQALRKQNDG